MCQAKSGWSVLDRYIVGLLLAIEKGFISLLSSIGALTGLLEEEWECVSKVEKLGEYLCV